MDRSVTALGLQGNEGLGPRGNEGLGPRGLRDSEASGLCQPMPCGALDT